MASLKKIFEKIKEKIFNRSSKTKLLESGNIENAMENTVFDRKQSFRNEMQKIYSEATLISDILAKMGANNEIINNKVACNTIKSHIQNILQQNNIEWPPKETKIAIEEMNNIIETLKKHEKIQYGMATQLYDKTNGKENYMMHIDEKGNVVLDKMKIYPSDMRTLAEDEFTSRTISVDDNGNMRVKGYAQKLDALSIYSINKENAEREFDILYNNQGNEIKGDYYTYQKSNGEKVLKKEEHLNENDFMTSKDFARRDELIRYIKDNGREGIDTLFKENPNFINELKSPARTDVIFTMLDYDFTSIVYDKENADVLYDKYIDKVINSMKQSRDYKEYGNLKVEINELEKVKNEIYQPKEVEEGKYKIPHKYLFEALRMGANICREDGHYRDSMDADDYRKLINGSKTLGIGTCNNVMSYLEVDGKLPKEYGEEMAKLYDSKDYYVLQHKYDERRNIKEEVYRNGKINSTRHEAERNNLSCTTTGNYNKSMSFQELLSSSGGTSKIIMKIPKKAFEKDNDIPVWGAEEPNGNGYILPDYVIGSIDSKGDFEKNYILESDRKKYQYHFKDNSVKPIELSKNEIEK